MILENQREKWKVLSMMAHWLSLGIGFPPTLSKTRILYVVTTTSRLQTVLINMRFPLKLRARCCRLLELDAQSPLPGYHSDASKSAYSKPYL